MKHTYVVTKTANGISISDSYYDRSAEQDVSNVYELTAPKSNSLAKSCAGTYQCSNSEIIAVLENGIVTKYDGNATTYGYISGTISNVKIVYKTGSSSSVTTKTGKYDAKSLVLGGKIYVKNPSAFASYYNSNNGTFYVYTREGKATLYTYKGTSYATIDGELAIGNVVTVSYTDADGKAQSFVAKITGKRHMTLQAQRVALSQQRAKTASCLTVLALQPLAKKHILISSTRITLLFSRATAKQSV